jgi:hypothetical protein
MASETISQPYDCELNLFSQAFTYDPISDKFGNQFEIVAPITSQPNS